MPTDQELEAEVERLESELSELKAKVDESESADGSDAGEQATGGMTRRGLLGVGGAMGLGGLLGASSAVDTARAQSNGDVYLPNAEIGGVVDIRPNVPNSGQLAFLDAADSSNNLFYLDPSDRNVVVQDADLWVSDKTINDVGAIDNSALTGGSRLESLVGNETYIENGELRVSGGGGGVDDGLAEKLEIIADPPATSLVETGAPTGDPHSNDGWGPVFQVNAPTHWRGAYVDADAADTAEFAVYEMSDDPFNVDSSNPYRSREFQLSSGVQFVPLEMYLEPGVYHFCQRSGTAIRRVSTDTDWDALDSAGAPLEFAFGSWHYDREPGMDGQEVLDAILAGNEDSILDDVDDDFAQIFEAGWDSILHYVADWDVGHE